MRRHANLGAGRSAARWLASAVALMSVLQQTAYAQVVNEDAVKAAFLWRFASFVTWRQRAPSGPADPLRLCVVGSRGFADRVEAIGQSGGQPNIRLLKLERADPSAGCHIAFIGVVDSEDVSGSLRTFRDAAILTVTDEAIGSERGVIHFQVVDRRVRFHVDLAEAEKRGLVLNSRLLGVAITITRSAGAKP